MDDWFSAMAANAELPASTAMDLRDVGYAVLPDVLSNQRLAQICGAFDSAVANAGPDDLRVGSTTTRVHDFVNRGPEFDSLYLHGPILEACCRVIRQPFKLSSLFGRTVNSHAPAQDLHVDFAREVSGWPMVGFIVMLDEFRSDNGATRFIPGSHRWPRYLLAL